MRAKSRPMAARAQWRVRLALVACGLLLPLLLLEIVLQLAGPILPGEYQLGTLMVPHPQLGHFHARDVRVWVRTSEFVAHVRTNRFGLRGPAIAAARPPNVGRVLLLGDSFVEAKQVPESESLAGLLQERLGGTGGRCEVMNAGVAAWGTGEEYVYLREEGTTLQPNLVVVFFYIGNDLGNNVRKVSGHAPQHRGPPFRLDAEGRLMQLDWQRVDEPPAGLAFARRYSRALNLLETGFLSRLDDDDEVDRTDPTQLTRPDAGKLDLYAVKETSERRQAWQITEALLTAIRDESAAAGAQVAIVAIPATYQVYDREWRRVAPRGRSADRWEQDVPNRRLAEILQRLGIAYLDLLPAFQAAARADRERLYFPIDAHWTAQGNRLAADEVERFLTSGPGLLPQGCS